MIDLLLVGSFHSSSLPGGVKTGRSFYTTSCYCQGWGKGKLFQGEVSCWLSKCGKGSTGGPQFQAITCKLFAYPVDFIIDCVAVTAPCLTSLLFPVNRSYLNPRSLPFVSPVLLFSMPQEKGEKEGERDRATHDFSGNTIPKPLQRQIRYINCKGLHGSWLQ